MSVMLVHRIIRIFIFIEFKSNFEKVSEWASTAYEVPYDVNSVMHYPRHSFSKNGNETIVSKVSLQSKILCIIDKKSCLNKGEYSQYLRNLPKLTMDNILLLQKDPTMQLGQRVGATQGDLDKVRKMYSCTGNHTGMKPYGTPEWFLDQVNKFFKEQQYSSSTGLRI